MIKVEFENKLIFKLMKKFSKRLRITTISLAFLTITFEDVATEEVARIRKELLAYCALDTGGMVRIVERLEELAG